MRSDRFLFVGCAVLLVVCVSILGAGVRAYDNRKITAAQDVNVFSGYAMKAMAVGVVGTALLVVLHLLMGVPQAMQIRQGRQDLMARANRLHQEREQARARAMRAPPRPPPAQALEPDAQYTGQQPAKKPAPMAVAAAASVQPRRAARDIGLCPVCQTRVLRAEEYCTCPSCKTPYHSDCWAYNNGCGVYGCAVRIRV